MLTCNELLPTRILQDATQNEANMEVDKTAANWLHENEDEQEHKSSRRQDLIRSYGALQPWYSDPETFNSHCRDPHKTEFSHEQNHWEH